MAEVVEGPFNTHDEAALARSRIAKMPQWIRVAVYRGSEKPKMDLVRDKYYVLATYTAPLYPLPAPPAPPVPPVEIPAAKKEDFIRDMDLVYKCEGKSEFLNRYCREENVDATLKIDMRVVKEIEGPFDVKPPDRTYESVISSWKAFEEVVRRFHEPTKKWYWVTYPAILSWKPIVKPPTPMRQAYIDYFENPDIVTAIGLTPGVVQDSFSKVFSGYSIIDEKEAEPEPGDVFAVGAIISGAALASVATIMSLIPGGLAVATTHAMTGTAGFGPGIIKDIIKRYGLMKGAGKLTTAAAKIVFNPWFILLGGINLTVMNLWNMTDPMWWYGVWVKLSGDTKKRFESLKITIETKIKQAYNLVHINPNSIKLAEARSLLRATKPLINELFNLLYGYEINEVIKDKYPEFDDIVSSFVTQYNDLVVAADGIEDDFLVLEELKTPPPPIPTTFPEEFLLEDVIVEDGDTLMWPGHPEAKDRIRMLGIDAHESETEAGIEETEYLKSLIEHRQVKILTHQYHTPDMVIDIYGRLLGGVFLGDTDIVLAMLEHFGESILTAKKYWKKYRWIDWDLYKRTAKAATGPAVKEFKISVDSVPSNAKLFIDDSYTGHLTPSNEKELADVMHLLAPGEHVFKATKGGKEGSVKATITDGANPAIIIVLGVVGLEPALPEEVPAPVEPPVEVFSINIDSMPSNAKLYIDDIYTHHWTPSNEKELRDVMDLLVPGKHTIKVTKAGKAAEREVEILPGFNEAIFLALGVVGLAPPVVPPEVPPIPCGPAAAFYTLNKLGVPKTAEEICADLPTLKIPLTTEEFTFPRTLTEYLVSQGIDAEFKPDKTLDDLKREIDAGNQVIVMGNVYSEKWKMDLPHYWNVTGYDDATKTIKAVNAPDYSYDEFERRWKMLPISFLPLYVHTMIVAKGRVVTL